MTAVGDATQSLRSLNGMFAGQVRDGRAEIDVEGRPTLGHVDGSIDGGASRLVAYAIQAMMFSFPK